MAPIYNYESFNYALERRVSKIIYFDNGATSFPKPRGMVTAMEDCMLKYCGNPGRSGHSMSMKTGEEVYHARRVVAELFNISEAERIIFTKNTTEALNMGLQGFLERGDHVITTSMEHNSVLRPLKSMEKRGVSHTIINGNCFGEIKACEIEKAIKNNTKLIVVTAASNVTGTKMPIKEIGRVACRHNIKFMVDGAQGAGTMDLNVKDCNISMLAVPGHKGLLGPLGTGFLYVSPDTKIKPSQQGGTGTESKSRVQPEEFPEGFESGTINAPGIIGLGYSAGFVKKIGTDVIRDYEEELICYLDRQLLNMDFVSLYGPDPARKTGISLINIDGVEAEEVTSILNSKYNIAVRGGFHCAGLAHKTVGTWDTGGVRISVGPFNTRREIEKLVDAIWEIGRERRQSFSKRVDKI